MIALLLVSAPFLSIGENPMSREVIAYDPERMPHLQLAYEAFAKELAPNLSSEDLLKKVRSYMRETVFDMNQCSEDAVRSLVSQRRQLSLDFFVASKIGVCRHFALATQYFLEKLIDDGKLQGTCELIRAVVPKQGKHAWILVHEGNHLWHLDTYWGFFGDLNTPKDRSWLMPLYGYQEEN